MLDSGKSSVINILDMLKKYWYLPLIMMALGFVTSYIAVEFIITPVYRVKASLFTSSKKDINSDNMNLSQLTIHYKIINDYKELLKSKLVKKRVIENLMKFNSKMKQSQAELILNNCKILGEGFPNKRFFYITVKTSKPEVALSVANAVIPAFIGESYNIIKNDNIVVVDQPTLNNNVFPNKKVFLIIGSILGFGLCIGFFIAVDYFNDKLKSLKELENITDTKVASCINFIQNEKASLDVSMYHKEHTPFREAINLLRENLENSIAAKEDNSAKIIGFSSVNKGDGKSIISSSLAMSFKEINKRTLVLDLDLRRPTLHKKLLVKNENGIVDYLTGNKKATDIIANKNGCDYIVSGAIPLYPVNLLKSPKCAQLFEELSHSYDYIICDTSPLVGIVDPIVISKYIDVFMLVIDFSKVKKDNIEQAISLLNNNNINIHGLVVNKYFNRSDNYSYTYEY